MSVYAIASSGDAISLARPCPHKELAAHGNSSCTCARVRGVGGPMLCSNRIAAPAGQCEVSSSMEAIKELWYPAFSPVPCALGFGRGGLASTRPLTMAKPCMGNDEHAAACWRDVAKSLHQNHTKAMHADEPDGFTPAMEGLVAGGTGAGAV